MECSFFRTEPRNAAVAACVLSLALATPLFAAGDPQGSDITGKSSQASPMSAQPGISYRSSALLGKAIDSSDGQKLGNVTDLVIAPAGELRYVVIAYGGFLGMGNKVSAVPWNRIEVPAAKGAALKLDISKERFAEAPTFDKDKWSSMSDAQWTAQVDSFYSGTGQARAAAPASGQSKGFTELDANGDGTISKDEARERAGLEEEFDLADSNHDGRIDQSEFSAVESSEPQPPPSDGQQQWQRQPGITERGYGQPDSGQR